jgi:guanylate kinase
MESPLRRTSKNCENRFKTLSEMTQTGNLIIVSGPSGAGKSALVTNALRSLPKLKFSISYTTRAPRGAEQNGVEYFFVGHQKFKSLIDSGDLLEWAEVYGNYYGTSRTFVDNLMQQGADVILDVDVQGAQSIRQKRPDAVEIFVLPPSFQVLRERLRRRSLDDESVIEKRLNIACKEINRYKDYDYLIINEDLDNAARELESIIVSARCRTSSRNNSVISILETFGGMDAKNP